MRPRSKPWAAGSKTTSPTRPICPTPYSWRTQPSCSRLRDHRETGCRIHAGPRSGALSHASKSSAPGVHRPAGHYWMGGTCLSRRGASLWECPREQAKRARALASLLALRGIDTTLLQVSGCLHLRERGDPRRRRHRADQPPLGRRCVFSGLSMSPDRSERAVRCQRPAIGAHVLCASRHPPKRKNGWKRIASPRQRSMPASSPRLKEA